LKICKTEASAIICVCDHRNEQQRSSNDSHPADGAYETPNPTGQDDQPQYDVIQRGHTQQGPNAGRYESLNPQTQGEQPQYVAISRHQNAQDAPDYIDAM